MLRALPGPEDHLHFPLTANLGTALLRFIRRSSLFVPRCPAVLSAPSLASAAADVPFLRLGCGPGNDSARVAPRAAVIWAFVRTVVSTVIPGLVGRIFFLWVFRVQGLFIVAPIGGLLITWVVIIIMAA